MDISFAIRKFQKSVAGISMLTILASFVSFAGVAQADTFPDVDSDHYAYDAVDEASNEGWMTGYENGTFGVDDTLTRAQAAKILVLGADYDVDTEYDAGFTDVSSSDSLEDYVNTAAEYGIFGGYTDADGTPTGEFGYNDPMTRAQFAKTAVEAFGLDYASDSLDEFPDVTVGSWFEQASTYYISTAWQWSVINGYENGYFYPDVSVTRGQAAIIINNAQEPVMRSGDDDDDDTTSSGALWVEVSDESPDSMTIPSNATSVTLAAWDFTASDDDVELDGLTVHQYGVSSLSSTHQVYLYEGTTRLTSGTTINSTTHAATFTNLNLAVDSGDTVTLSVRMDMGDYTSSSEVGLEIEDADMVDANSDVDGDFPAMGELHDISTTDAGTVTIEKNGTVDNADVGEDGASIAKFKLSTATESGGVEEIGLLLGGSVNTGDVENFNLYVVGDDSEPVATVDGVDDNDVVRFVLDGDWDTDSSDCTNSSGYCISKGSSKSFYVTADFNTGRTSDTVEVYLDQSTDLFVRGNLYDTGMSVTRTNYDGNANSCSATTDADCSYMTLQGGDVTISSNGPAAMDIATNADDVSILDFNIVSVTDVTFDSFEITLVGSESADTTEGLMNNTAPNFTDVKIWDNTNDESLYAGVDSDVFKTATGGSTAITEGAGDSATAYYLFTDDFVMEAGEELDLSLTLDVANTSTLDGMTLTGALNLGTTYPQLKDTNNKTLTNSTVLVPTSAVTSKTMTVRSPSLTLSLASTPVSGSTSYVKGAQDVPFTGIVMACGTASDCTVTDVSLVGTIDEDGGATFASTAGTPGVDNAINVNSVVGRVWLVDEDGEMVADSSASVTASTGVVTMDNLDISIPAGESPVYTVVGDVKSDSFYNNNSESIAFKVTSASNIVAQDEEGNTISVTGTVNHPSATTATTYVLVTSGGSLTVTVDSSTALEDIAVAGTDDVSTSTFKFTGTAEPFVVKKLAVNAYQNGVADGDLAEYDNQVGKVYLTYTNSDGDEETVSASLVSGQATFNSVDLYVDKDDSATVEVTADLNEISTGESTAGDPVRLDLAFNNFEATAQDSGETYYASKLDNDVLAASDLDFGTISWTDSNVDVDGAGTAAALKIQQTLLVDDGAGADANIMFPVGTLICTSADTSCGFGTVSNDRVWVVSAAQADGTNEDTMYLTLLDNGIADITSTATAADNDNLLYALPGGTTGSSTGYLTTSNQMTVYETKPTVALSSSSPSGSKNVSTDESAFIFNVSANAKELVQFRAAATNTASVIGYDNAGANNAAPTTTTTAGAMVDGSGSTVTLTNYTASDSAFVGQFSSDLTGYTRASFWIRFVDSGADNALTFAGLKTNVIASSTADPNTGGVALSQSLCGADQATLVSGEWYRCDIALSGNAASENFFSIELDAFPGTITGDTLQVDQLLAYNDRIVVDVTTDSDVDTYANNTDNAGGPSVAYLKDGSTTLATGYWESATNGASATTTATLTLIPTTAIEVAKGTTRTMTLHVNTGALVNEDTGSDDPVTFSMDAGSSTDGTVTAGDLWWNDTNSPTLASSVIKWLGNVSSTRVTGNTLTY